jgi:hypothetical protein
VAAQSYMIVVSTLASSVVLFPLWQVIASSPLMMAW